jgi:hypothetical protein
MQTICDHTRHEEAAAAASSTPAKSLFGALHAALSARAPNPRTPCSPIWALFAHQVHPLLEAGLNCKALQQSQGKVVAAATGTAAAAAKAWEAH